MKASIRDEQVLAAVHPLEFAAYLRSTGWHQTKVTNRWATWVKDGDFEIALPLTDDLGDFVSRIADALRTLEVVEDRSQLEILHDISPSSAWPLVAKAINVR